MTVTLSSHTERSRNSVPQTEVLLQKVTFILRLSTAQRAPSMVVTEANVVLPGEWKGNKKDVTCKSPAAVCAPASSTLSNCGCTCG